MANLDEAVRAALEFEAPPDVRQKALDQIRKDYPGYSTDSLSEHEVGPLLALIGAMSQFGYETINAAILGFFVGRAVPGW